IGGSSGYTSIELAKAFPRLRLVVQDMSSIGLEKGKEIVSNEPALRSRITFIEHDFFQTQPLTADVYLFRQILHDWSDNDCVRILKALLPALKTGARILISECVMPEPPAKQGALLENKEARIVDQVMLAAHGGRERSVAEYSDLFEQASKGFKYAGVSENIMSGYYSLIEYRFTEPSPATNNISKASTRAVKCYSCLF
ncbi:MAG: hypothetical protein Q9214_006833, partial [Letrouitia sp. 1 TL-2023]